MINFILGKFAEKIENYSSFVEFSRLEGKILNINF
jgi:hypothetical protein